jgi:zinc transport system substrate-binding protein
MSVFRILLISPRTYDSEKSSMGNSYRRIIFIFFSSGAFLFSLTPFSFGQTTQKLTSITTLFPLYEFSRAVGKERVQVNLLLPPGAEPHTWEPKPSDIAKISKADFFIFIGLDMEPWVGSILKTVKGSNLKVVEVSKGFHNLVESDHESHGKTPPTHGKPEKMDPHIWLDFSLDMKIVDTIVAAFAERDPSSASFFRANGDDYKSKLDVLDRQYRASLLKCRHRQIILGGHSAFAYLARRYGLEQIALYGLSPNAEPTSKKLTELIQLSKKNGVKVIYFEELLNPKLARVMAKEAGMETLPLNAGHNLTKDQQKQKITFLDLMEKNRENLTRGLECE